MKTRDLTSRAVVVAAGLW